MKNDSEVGKSSVLGMVFALFLLAGCAQGPQVPLAVERTDEAFVTAAQDSGTIGAFMLIRTKEGQYTSSFGTNGLDDITPPDADTVFRIGSNTKTWTGTIVLQLVDEGLISLDDPVSKYIEGVPSGDDITVEMLLNMRSGLFSYTDDEEWFDQTFTNLEESTTPEEVLEVAFSHEAVLAPGEGYHYSNTNTVLAGLIAEKVTGQTLQELVSERIADPLGLEKTVLPAADDVTMPEVYARGYTVVDADTGELIDLTDANPSWGFGAGAGYSTASELADFADALVGGEFLSEDLHAKRLGSLIPVTEDTSESSPAYGLGIARLEGLYGHNGLIPGYNSFMGVDPERGLTVIIWANVAPNADGMGPAGLIAKEVVPILLEGL